MALHVEDEFIAAERFHGGAGVERRIGRHVEHRAFFRGVGVRLIDRQQCRRRAAGGNHEAAPGRALASRVLARPLARQRIAGEIVLFKRDGGEFAV